MNIPRAELKFYVNGNLVRSEVIVPIYWPEKKVGISRYINFPKEQFIFILIADYGFALGSLEICHVHGSASKLMFFFVSLGLDCCLTAQLTDRQHSSNPHMHAFNSYPYIAK